MDPDSQSNIMKREAERGIEGNEKFGELVLEVIRQFFIFILAH